MWLTIALGLGTSLATEIVHWLDKKFTGTLLQGYSSFLLATVIALVGALAKVAFTSGISGITWQAMATYFSQVFTVGQLWFILIYQKLGLDVKPPTQTVNEPVA